VEGCETWEPDLIQEKGSRRGLEIVKKRVLLTILEEDDHKSGE